MDADPLRERIARTLYEHDHPTNFWVTLHPKHPSRIAYEMRARAVLADLREAGVLREASTPSAVELPRETLDAMTWSDGSPLIEDDESDRCPTCGSDDPKLRGWDAEHQGSNRPIMHEDWIECPAHGDVGHSREHGRCQHPWHSVSVGEGIDVGSDSTG